MHMTLFKMKCVCVLILNGLLSLFTLGALVQFSLGTYMNTQNLRTVPVPTIILEWALETKGVLFSAQ